MVSRRRRSAAGRNEGVKAHMRAASSPAIEGSQLLLRPVEFTDAEEWFAYLSMPDAVLHTSWAVSSVDDLAQAIAQYNSSSPSSNIRFAIESRQSGALLGTIGFHTISPIHRTAEIAYDIHPAHWGRGIATSCCRAVTDWGFSQQGYVRVQATALESNSTSIRVLEKCVFLLEGKLRNFRIVRGEPRNFWLYSKVSGPP